jgi:hypothetical protein
MGPLNLCTEATPIGNTSDAEARERAATAWVAGSEDEGEEEEEEEEVEADSEEGEEGAAAVAAAAAASACARACAGVVSANLSGLRSPTLLVREKRNDAFGPGRSVEVIPGPLGQGTAM